MVAPSMILIAVVAAWPVIYAIWLSLHEYSVRVAGLSRWAGFGNYSSALGNSDWWAALGHTLIFTVASVALETLIGLAMALAMHAAFKGQGLLRTTVLVPWALLTVVTAIIWRTMFVSPYGFVNTILGTKTVWLGSEPQALIIIILADVWKTAPFMALLILAGLQVIPGEVYEAAKVDGASTWQRFKQDHAAAAAAGDPRRPDLQDARCAQGVRLTLRADAGARTAPRRCRRSPRRRSPRTGSTGSGRRWRCSRSSS